MKFCKPFIDCGKGMTVFVTNYGFDIFLQRDEKMIFISQCLVDGRTTTRSEVLSNTVRAGVDDAALDEFLLYPHEYFTWDNGLMAVFHIILRYDAVVLYSSLSEEVSGVCFL